MIDSLCHGQKSFRLVHPLNRLVNIYQNNENCLAYIMSSVYFLNFIAISWVDSQGRTIRSLFLLKADYVDIK